MLVNGNGSENAGGPSDRYRQVRSPITRNRFSRWPTRTPTVIACTGLPPGARASPITTTSIAALQAAISYSCSTVAKSGLP